MWLISHFTVIIKAGALVSRQWQRKRQGARTLEHRLSMRKGGPVFRHMDIVNQSTPVFRSSLRLSLSLDNYWQIFQLKRVFRHSPRMRHEISYWLDLTVHN